VVESLPAAMKSSKPGATRSFSFRMGVINLTAQTDGATVGHRRRDSGSSPPRDQSQGQLSAYQGAVLFEI
jgi:hypothetical protein